jgi:hypothetical protein
MPNPFRFDGTISLGNILVIVAWLVLVIAAWTANRDRTFDNAKAIDQLAIEVNDLETRLRAVEHRAP